MKNFTLTKNLFYVLVFLLFPLINFSQTVLSFENFNSTFGIWTPGSGNVTIDGTTPYEGANAVRIRGNTGMTLSTPAIGLLTTPYNKVDVKFFVRAFGSGGETIALQYRPNALAVWTTVRTYTLDLSGNSNDMVANNTYYGFYATLFSTAYTFSATSQFQFVANISSGGRAFYLDSVSIIGTTFNTITKAPGGITANLETWLKADKVNGTGVGTDGAFVNSWEDVGKGNDATVIDPNNPAFTNRPVYKNNSTNNMNFNPVVNFNNDPNTSVRDFTSMTNKAELSGTGGFFSNEQFIVVLQDNPTTFGSTTNSEDIFCAQGQTNLPYDTDGTGFGFGKYTIRTDNEVISYCHGSTPNNGTATPVNGRGYGVCQNSTTVTYTNFAGILSARNKSTNNGVELYFNANKIDNMEVGVPQFANQVNRRYWLGRSQVFNGSFGGRIAEVISYSVRKDDVTERRRIESYLAIKYGITLGINGTSLTYQNSAGSTIWDATANAGYNFDIAGIGRDDASELSQKQSRSINPTEVMTIGLADIFATNSANTNAFDLDKKYLVWGSNGGTMANTGTPYTINLGPTTITTITEVVNRKWKIVETGGDVPMTRVNIPTASFISGLPALGPTDAYVMLIADDAAFTNNIETVFMTTSGSNQTLLYDFDGTRFFTFGVAHRATNPLHISLDGFDDFVRISDSNELSPSFTVMTWIRPNGANTLADERTIIAKKANATSGYRLVLQNDNKIRMEWTIAGVTFSSITNTAIPNQKWHNIAATYGGTTLTLYIDGVVDKTSTIALAPVATASTFSIGSQYISKASILNLFKGDIDELRMWSRVLTATEIRFLMNQEILQNGTGTKGTIMPTTITRNDITGVLWANLYAYYSMNSYIGTHLDDDSNNLHRGSLIIPNKISINPQTAPMPYLSTANGSWAAPATWANGAIQDLPYSLSIIDNVTPIDWNIVKTLHNVDSAGNKTLLGLFVNTNTLSASNNSKIEVSHYLKLDGKIDLTGMSQLVQQTNSDLDPTSAGSLERDQQGNKSRFNYNYWCSPVGAINATTNNNAYTVAGVMKDGTTATPQNVTWTPAYNGSATSPITLSSYWIFKFQNVTNAYANWSSIGPNGSLSAGQGYTLKGDNAPGANQNYTFVGKPNNGLITTPIAANNLNLSGNPYPSALDATAFINDNSSVITGTLYFWQHYTTNTTHNLVLYQGGYAARNLTGGVAPVAPAGISGLGSSTSVPGRYIPVGQGFFVTASATGGTITFNNNQRGFFKENDAVNSNTMFKNIVSTGTTTATNHFTENNNDATASDNFKKVRIGFNSPDNHHRQLLLGFMDQKATNGIDNGYDGEQFEDNPSDMYFLNTGVKLLIQGDTYFTENASFPIGVKTETDGNVQFSLDGTENFDPEQNISIYDNITGQYHDIRNEMFEINLPAGTIDNRFFLRFKNTALGVNSLNPENSLIAKFTNDNNSLTIKNSELDNSVTSVSVFNLLGQSLKTVKIENQDQANIVIPIQNLSTGTYIIKIQTTAGTFSKKIIIK